MFLGRRPGRIVAKPRIESGQIHFVIEQVIERMFEAAGQQLPLQVHRKVAWAGVDVFVTRHTVCAMGVLQFDLDIYFGSRHDAQMFRLFLQPCYASA